VGFASANEEKAATPSVGVAAATALDLVPEGAAAVLSISDTDRLRVKGEELIEATGLKVTLKPTQLFQLGYTGLGVNGIVDESAPAAIILAQVRFSPSRRCRSTLTTCVPQYSRTQ
jgi:hypothetical protein